MCSDRRKIAGYCLSSMCVHIERAATRVCYVSLTGVCSVSGVLYHLKVNVAEGDISCVSGEATRRLGLCLRLVCMCHEHIRFTAHRGLRNGLNMTISLQGH